MLLGDAVHPMMPNLGQGGCQAIEDAYEQANICLLRAPMIAGLIVLRGESVRRTSTKIGCRAPLESHYYQD